MRSRESTPNTTYPLELCTYISKCFYVKVCSTNFAVVLPKPGWMKCFDSILDHLESLGLQAKLVERGDEIILVFFRLRRSWRSHVFLVALGVTLLTVLLAGFDVARAFSSLVGGGSLPFLAFTFLAGLLGPLVVHESGHLAAAKRGRVPVSLPLFLPAPPPSLGGIGTFGAVINMRGLARDRESLAILGLMGPLMGFLAALPLAWIGLTLSPVLPATRVGGGAGVGFTPLILLLLAAMLGAPSNSVVVLHPLALASFIVFLVTFLNLLPIGQLDGAHVVYGVFGERVYMATGYVVLTASILTSFLVPQLVIIALFSVLAYMLNLFIAKGRHPGVLNPYKPMPAWKAGLIVACYLALLVLTLPVPYQ